MFESKGWSLFREIVASSGSYAEWGSGLSTFYAAIQSKCDSVLTVETDPEWAMKISKVDGLSSEKIQVRHIDFGDVGNWGRPKGYSNIQNIWQYSSSPFMNGFNPDTILVDGRIRVHCFLETLLRARRGTKAIFDDDVSREHYRIAENFIQPTENRDRSQASSVFS